MQIHELLMLFYFWSSPKILVLTLPLLLLLCSLILFLSFNKGNNL